MKEIDESIKNEREIDHNSLNKLNYLSAVINEALRMYSPLFSNIPHEVEEEFSVQGVNFKKGFFTAIIFRFILYNEDNFEKPNEFLPERWLDGV